MARLEQIVSSAKSFARWSIISATTLASLASSVFAYSRDFAYKVEPKVGIVSPTKAEEPKLIRSSGSENVYSTGKYSELAVDSEKYEDRENTIAISIRGSEKELEVTKEYVQQHFSSSLQIGDQIFALSPGSRTYLVLEPSGIYDPQKVTQKIMLKSARNGREKSVDGVSSDETTMSEKVKRLNDLIDPGRESSDNEVNTLFDTVSPFGGPFGTIAQAMKGFTEAQMKNEIDTIKARFPNSEVYLLPIREPAETFSALTDFRVGDKTTIPLSTDDTKKIRVIIEGLGFTKGPLNPKVQETKTLDGLCYEIDISKLDFNLAGTWKYVASLNNPGKREYEETIIIDSNGVSINRDLSQKVRELEECLRSSPSRSDKELAEIDLSDIKKIYNRERKLTEVAKKDGNLVLTLEDGTYYIAPLGRDAMLFSSSDNFLDIFMRKGSEMIYRTVPFFAIQGVYSLDNPTQVLPRSGKVTELTIDQQISLVPPKNEDFIYRISLERFSMEEITSSTYVGSAIRICKGTNQGKPFITNPLKGKIAIAELGRDRAILFTDELQRLSLKKIGEIKKNTSAVPESNSQTSSNKAPNRIGSEPIGNPGPAISSAPLTTKAP